MTNDLLKRLQIRASNPASIHSMADVYPGETKIYPLATREQIAATEAAIGFELPKLLKAIFTTIGNGGFGPGYGLIGVEGGYADFRNKHLADLAHELGALDRRILPICNWGCGIYSCLECAKPEVPVSIFNPQTHALDPENISKISITSSSGKVTTVFEREKKPSRPSIQTPKNLKLIPHKASFHEFLSDWADGSSLWDEIQPRLS